MKLKKILTIMFLGVATLILAGCSNGGSSSSSDGGKTKITFWYRMDGAYKKALESYIADFNKSQNKYEVVGASQGSYDQMQQKIVAAAKSNTLPTLSQVTDIIVPEYVKNGFIDDISDLVNKGDDKLTDKELNDIYPGIRENLKYNEKYYTMPFATGSRIMFYNKDILDKYKLEVPKNWEDFKKISDVLSKDGITTVGFNKSYDFEFETLAYENGNRLVDKNLKVNIDSSKSVESMEFITDMLKDKSAVTAGTDNYFNVPFVRGKMFAGFGSSATIKQIQNTAPKDMKWGTAIMPAFKGKEASILGNNGLSIFKGASKDQRAGAWKFMKYLMSDKVQADWGEKTGYVPVVKSAVDSKSYQDLIAKQPEFKAAIDALQTAVSPTPFVGYNEYRANLYSAIDSTISLNTKPKDALNKLQKSTEEIVKKGN